MLSFGQALEKLSFKLTPRGKQEVKAERHFKSEDPNWSEFEKNLRSKTFQEVAKGHKQADPKLKRYIENYGGYLTSKETVAVMKSPDSGKVYRLKQVGKRIGCNCGDWQYKHSHKGSDCKHIERYRQMTKVSGVPLSLAKQAFVNDLMTAGAGLAYNHAKAKKQLTLGRASSLHAQMRKTEQQEKMLRG
jgi:hypothetical protein